MISFEQFWQEIKKMKEKKLTPKQLKLLNALFTERTIQDAYKTAGVSVATGQRYRQLPRFIAAYDKRQRALINATNNRLRALSGQAVETLADVLNDPEATNTDKVRAAKVVLDTTYKNIELEELRRQVDKLEREQGKNEYWKFTAPGTASCRKQSTSNGNNRNN